MVTFGRLGLINTDVNVLSSQHVPRPSHLPHNTERSALQRLIGEAELTANGLHPAGPPTIAKMVAKTWIKEVGNGAYRITPAGTAALKAEIPTPSRRRVR